jgi:hypothetical protein
VRRKLQQVNGRIAARRNVAHHYDISNDLYRRFLDADMQYSCAYFERPDMTLEEAQAAKKAHIAAKLSLKPGTTGARHRLGLGRHGHDAGQGLWRGRHRRDALDRTTGAGA